MKSFFVKLMASVCFCGYAPIASGTVGTIPAFVFLWFVDLSVWAWVALLLVGTAVSIAVATPAEKLFGKKDDGRIVIDELIGACFALCGVPKILWVYCVAFSLFRAFDVIKPFGIRKSQQLKGGWGIVIDDVLAGIATNMVIQIIVRIQ